ncbi:receptor-like protein 7 [Triticum dicoccoides]|uniref:receptor-like protein 7 n=1 Tax=Triticum dicoccoides TaxID=85692 RepID=UPI00188EE4B7|nr:receptor-like protein 7 [Triticum dicoccoides]
MSSMMTHHMPLVMLLLLLVQTQLAALNSHHPWAASTLANHTAIIQVRCLPDQASALLHLKRSFTTTDVSAAAFRSWRAGTDCCHWEGIRCGATNGRVTSLDLGDRGLESDHLDHVLFQLTSLRYLNLGGNNFSLSKIPSIGFEKLTRLTHLNLSISNFAGQVPVYSIGCLTDLISLDLSFYSEITELFDTGFMYGADLTYNWQPILPNITALVANLTSLEELHLSWVDMSDQGDKWCDALAKYMPNLRVLSLPFCLLSSPICGSLAGLHSLSVLNLQFNHLTGSIPEFLASLSSLSVLQLSYNRLEGWVPPVFFQHKNLVTIDLHHNHNISGNLPNFSTDSSLENLFVGDTNFSGTIPSSISNLKHLKKLGLNAPGFAGELPSSIGMLRSLNSLQISGLGLVGLISSWITNLTSLEVLEVSYCGLNGPIPSDIGDLNKLRKLALYKSNFSGKIPPRILNLTQLDTLQLHSNNLIGTIQLNSFWKLQNLSDFNLSNNKLSVIEDENNSSVSSFPNITYLGLASCNIKDFPNILRHSNGIKEFGLVDISNNQIHGAIPQWAWEKWTGAYGFFLNLSHNEFTSIGYETFLPFSIISLDLSFNMFEGPIPLPQYTSGILDYSSNHFTSIPLNIATQLEDTVSFKASRNHLSGNIPPSLCSKSLEILDLSYNNLNGSIPSCLIEDANALQVLNLRENQLHGHLPHNINESCMFEALDFNSNQIEGKLPRSLAYCKYLEVLDIGNNQISDTFPCWMTALAKLQVLILTSNKLFGQVSPPIADQQKTCQFPSLRILDLASNNLSGILTEEWFMRLKSMMVEAENQTLVMEYEGANNNQVYQVNTELTYKGSGVTFSKILRTLVFIDISNNAIHGSIPEAIGELILLQVLNMSHNSFTGPIPSKFGRLKQLESLDLSSNGISGEILQEIASLDFLTTLNLSYNMLEGRIPESPHFSTFDNTSFIGNTGLCGQPLSKKCSNETTTNMALNNSEEKSVDVMLFLFVGLGFGVGFAVAIVLIWVLPLRKKL